MGDFFPTCRVHVEEANGPGPDTEKTERSAPRRSRAPFRRDRGIDGLRGRGAE
jgi:hypothetical protein